MIFCDESGFTGINLVDSVQASFAYVSNDFSNEEAIYLLKIFDTGQAIQPRLCPDNFEQK